MDKNADKKYYYLRKSCCSGKVYGIFDLDGLKNCFGYSDDDSIKDLNDLERRLAMEYEGFEFPYYIEPVVR